MGYIWQACHNRAFASKCPTEVSHAKKHLAQTLLQNHVAEIYKVSHILLLLCFMYIRGNCGYSIQRQEWLLHPLHKPPGAHACATMVKEIVQTHSIAESRTVTRNTPCRAKDISHSVNAILTSRMVRNDVDIQSTKCRGIKSHIVSQRKVL